MDKQSEESENEENGFEDDAAKERQSSVKGVKEPKSPTYLGNQAAHRKVGIYTRSQLAICGARKGRRTEVTQA